jgi:hypothetical protein
VTAAHCIDAPLNWDGSMHSYDSSTSDLNGAFTGYYIGVGGAAASAQVFAIAAIAAVVAELLRAVPVVF